MTPASEGAVVGRVSWRRYGVIMVVACLGAVGMMTVMASGATAASFAVSGQQFKVSADTLTGTGFVQYGWVDSPPNTNDPGRTIPVAVSAFKHAELTNLCQSVMTSLPLVGNISLMIHAGRGSAPVTADNMFVDLNQLGGDAEFTNIEVGNDASALTKGPRNAQGFGHSFGQQADSVRITHLRQVAYALNAATFKLSGLDLTVKKGSDECF